jgi:large subunit ribosomal protein L21
MAETYAIVETGGKQYRAEKGATLLVERLADDEGTKVTLRPLMFSDGSKVVANGAELEKVKVEASVAEHLRGPKLRIFTYKAKKGSSKRSGHRQALTKLEVTDVKMLTRKPAAKKPAAKAEAKPATEVKTEVKPKAPTRKATTKRPAARTAAAKKPGAKKPAARKPAAKKPPARKTSTTKKEGS